MKEKYGTIENIAFAATLFFFLSQNDDAFYQELFRFVGRRNDAFALTIYALHLQTNDNNNDYFTVATVQVWRIIQARRVLDLKFS